MISHDGRQMNVMHLLIRYILRYLGLNLSVEATGVPAFPVPLALRGWLNLPEHRARRLVVSYVIRAAGRPTPREQLSSPSAATTSNRWTDLAPSSHVSSTQQKSTRK